MSSAASDSPLLPLCIDLDGTLSKTDILVESFFALLKNNPLFLFLVPLWLLGGKAHLKQEIANRVEMDVSLLPYDESFLAYVRTEAQKGCPIVLATASNRKFAQQVADYLGFFTEVLASDDKTNLSGRKKLEALMERFGERRFDYAGNHREDLLIWQHARRAILVNPGRRLEQAAKGLRHVDQVFNKRNRVSLQPYMKALRVHQWFKNLLLFVPLVAAHKVNQLELAGSALLAFVAFSLCASSAYVLNDLLDLPSDRGHPRKRQRPFAAGDIPLINGVLLIPVLLFASFVLASLLEDEFLLVLAAYLGLTLTYSFYLRKTTLIDIFTLAVLYTLRVIAGAAATAIPLSLWLLAFSMFIFLSLALVKRSAELRTVQENNESKARGRDYWVSDLEYLHSMGTSSGYLAVLVLALYMNSDDVAARYTYPGLLWLTCPLVLYWISRLWLKAGRGEMHDDPLVFALTDWVSRFIGLLIGLIVLLAV